MVGEVEAYALHKGASFQEITMTELDQGFLVQEIEGDVLSRDPLKSRKTRVKKFAFPDRKAAESFIKDRINQAQRDGWAPK
ncbi:MAG: hypothetical protein ACRD2H_04940 [Terriglobales bacterium]